MSFVIPVISSNLEVNNFSRDWVQVQRLNQQGTGKNSTITLTRPWSAINIQPNGYYDYVANGQPRFSYDPVTLQPLGWYIGTTIGQNYLKYSEDFSQTSTWDARNVTPILNTTFVSPSGDFTSYEINEGTSTGIHCISSAKTVLITNTSRHFISVFAKAGTCSTFNIVFERDLDGGSFATGRWVTFNLATGRISFGGGASVTEAAMLPYGNGWYRCIAVANANGVTYPNYNGVNFVMSSTTTSGSRLPSYTGTNRNMYLWGAQFSQTAASEYTPTYGLSSQPIVGGSSWTNGSTDYVTGGLDTSLFQNLSSGTLLFEWIPYGVKNGATAHTYAVGGSDTNYIGIGGGDGTYALSIRAEKNNVNTLNFTAGTYSPYVVNKIALAWDRDSAAVYKNGVFAGSSVPTGFFDKSTSSIQPITIGSYFASGTRDGWYRKLRFYPYRLPNQVLIGMTK
ncbi:MAG: phage head spike fiber domain-containing protein [Terrimicrobiaceae bacterium]